MTTPQIPTGNPFSVSKMWGARRQVKLTNNSNEISDQLLEVSLPSAATCAIYFVVRYLAGAGQVWTVTANFRIGVGRSSCELLRAFANQPAPGMPLEIVIPAQPVEALQVDFIVNGNPLPEIQLDVGCELAPITIIPAVKADESRFGQMPDMVDLVPVLEAPRGVEVPPHGMIFPPPEPFGPEDYDPENYEPERPPARPMRRQRRW